MYETNGVIYSYSLFFDMKCLCPALFSEVLRRTAAKLGEGVRLGQGKTITQVWIIGYIL